MKVAQELKEAHIARQVALAETAKHSQIGLEQGKQALRPVLVDIPTHVFLLCVIDALMYIALERPIAAGRVGVEPTARSDSEVRRLLHRLHREISGRVEDDRPLATDPGDNRGP